MSQDNFTVAELLQELKEDDSWEADPEVRKAVANALEALILRI
jgi:hypothetical protein